MYVPRELTTTFKKAIGQFPAVLVTGPRQSGKSTFVQHVLEGTPYLTFDDPLNREFAEEDPNGFLDPYQGRAVILDEIQYVPSLFNYLKIHIDQNRTPGNWILTGSQQFSLMKNVSETLAGRIALLDLAPFSLAELKGRDLQSICWTGLYPEPACHPERRDLWVRSYVQTYLERDVRQLEKIREFKSFETFVRLCAAFHGQEFHAAGLARDCGVSQPTIKAWSKVLEASYVTLMLPPFFRNYGKRIIKSPKSYFVDPALVAYLTRQPSTEALLRGSMGGFLFEGVVVAEAWKAFIHQGLQPGIFFWRSQDGLEVDLLVQAGGKVWPVEIKLTATPRAAHAKVLDRFQTLAGEEAGEQGVVVCTVNKETPLPGGHLALPWTEFPGWIRERASGG